MEKKGNNQRTKSEKARNQRDLLLLRQGTASRGHITNNIQGSLKVWETEGVSQLWRWARTREPKAFPRLPEFPTVSQISVQLSPEVFLSFDPQSLRSTDGASVHSGQAQSPCVWHQRQPHVPVGTTLLNLFLFKSLFC